MSWNGIRNSIVNLSLLFAALSLLPYLELPSALAEAEERGQRAITSQAHALTLGERLENLGLVFRDDSNSVLQEFWLLGRYHGQYYSISDSSDSRDGYETRRLRGGFQARLFNDLTIHAQMVSGSDVSPFYNGFTELWTQWSFSPELSLTVGQQKHRFTHDRNVSSRYLNYLERSMLTNMFGADYTPGVTLQGRVRNLSYYTGLFSNATGRNMGDAFGSLNSGFSYLAATYLDLGAAFGAENAILNLSYVYSDANNNATNLNAFDNGLSGALILTDGNASLITEVTAGLEGEESGDAFGINLQPGYFITEKLQLAARYQFAWSDREEGLQPQRRYEERLEIASGDLYQAVYLGLNYHLARHRLKLQGGVEYSRMNGQEALTLSAMLRFYFGPHSGGAFPMNQMLGNNFESD